MGAHQGAQPTSRGRGHLGSWTPELANRRLSRSFASIAGPSRMSIANMSGVINE